MTEGSFGRGSNRSKSGKRPGSSRFCEVHGRYVPDSQLKKLKLQVAKNKIKRGSDSSRKSTGNMKSLQHSQSQITHLNGRKKIITPRNLLEAENRQTGAIRTTNAT